MGIIRHMFEHDDFLQLQSSFQAHLPDLYSVQEQQVPPSVSSAARPPPCVQPLGAVEVEQSQALDKK